MNGESSTELILKARAGDEAALERLFARYHASLRRWAHGRLPRWARDIADTEDLLQETLAQTLRHLPRLQLDEEVAVVLAQPVRYFRGFDVLRDGRNAERARGARHAGDDGVGDTVRADSADEFAVDLQVAHG